MHCSVCGKNLQAVSLQAAEDHALSFTHVAKKKKPQQRHSTTSLRCSAERRRSTSSQRHKSSCKPWPICCTKAGPCPSMRVLRLMLAL